MSANVYKNIVPPLSGTASGANIATGKLVKISGAGGNSVPLIEIVSAAADDVYGLTLEAITKNATGAVGVYGIYEATAGAGGWTAGQALGPDANGNLIVAVTNTTMCAIALTTTAAAATGTVYLIPMSKVEIA